LLSEWRESVSRLRVAIGEELKSCPQVVTLGARSQIGDYPEEELELLRTADIIFFPTSRFVDLFATLGKVTFPTINCYRLRGERLKQVALLRMLNVPYPRTRVYYGHKQKQKILEDFAFPLIAKKPRGSAAGKNVFFIEDSDKLERYTRKVNPAYIQEHVQPEIELRVVVINYEKVFGSYRRVVGGDFRENSIHTGAWQTKNMPGEAIPLAKKIARQGSLSDVMVEMIFDGSQFQVLEMNFQYNEMGDVYPGQERFKTIMEMIERGEL
jgi:ribosomal protein S6--L-glutamate ligase